MRPRKEDNTESLREEETFFDPCEETSGEYRDETMEDYSEGDETLARRAAGNDGGRRGSHAVKFAAAILLFAVLAVLAVAAVVNTMLSKINRPDIDQQYYTEEELEEINLAEAVENGPGEQNVVYPELDPSLIEWSSANQIEASKDVVNILLIGQDKREGQERQRSDAMVLVTFNQTDDSVTMTSFLRDMYVQIPGYQSNRINAAYAFGGMELLDETLELNFGIRVDANVEVDFDRFTRVIDLLGGVDVILSDSEADYLKLGQGGLTHLSGDQALQYARIRSLDSDFGRTGRQRNVLKSVYDAFRDVSITTAISLMNEIFPLLTTDLSNTEMLRYAVKLLPTVAAGNLTSQHIPAEGSYYFATINKMEVIVVDFEKNRDLLYDTLGGE